MIVLSNNIITFFKMEKNFPNLGKWIKLRAKMANYFIVLDLVIISGIIISLIYLNTKMLIH
jgi:hypothetical protein